MLQRRENLAEVGEQHSFALDLIGWHGFVDMVLLIGWVRRSAVQALDRG
jgi:hypothetical protein